MQGHRLCVIVDIGHCGFRYAQSEAPLTRPVGHCVGRDCVGMKRAPMVAYATDGAMLTNTVALPTGVYNYPCPRIIKLDVFL